MVTIAGVRDARNSERSERGYMWGYKITFVPGKVTVWKLEEQSTGIGSFIRFSFKKHSWKYFRGHTIYNLLSKVEERLCR